MERNINSSDDLTTCLFNYDYLQEAIDAADDVRGALAKLKLLDWQEDDRNVTRGHVHRLIKRLHNLQHDEEIRASLLKLQRENFE